LFCPFYCAIKGANWLSPTRTPSLSRPFAHLLDAPVRAKFAISNFEVESAKDLTKNKVANWLNFRVIQSGSECFSGSVVGCGCSEVVQMCRHFLLRDFRTGESKAARKREARMKRREIYLAARLRLFGFLALTIIAPPPQAHIHAHVHTLLYIYTDICIGFFFQSLDFEDILRRIQRFSNWLCNT